jgi:surface antigen
LGNIKVFVRRCEGRGSIAAHLGVLAAVLALPGCSFPIPGFIDASPTGSVRAPTYPFDQEDWAKAQPALIAAIGANSADDPPRWVNDASGRSGVVVGVGARFAKGGATCRAFVARIFENDDARQAEGSACLKGGEVTLTDAAPFPKV